VLPPDVNSSRVDFTVCDEGLRFGLGAVKGVGERAIEAITTARESGPFTSLGDFCLRTSGSQVNRRIIEGLIKAGAFDSVDTRRGVLLATLDASMAWAVREHDDRAAGQIGLFAAGSGRSQPEPEPANVAEWDVGTRLDAEHESVGFYISGHPLDRYLDDLQFLSTATTAELETKRDQDVVKIAGVTNTVRRKNSRKGERYATFNLEDREGVVEVIAWPDVYSKTEAAIVGREPVYVSGKLELGERGGRRQGAGDDGNGGGNAIKPQIIAEEIVPLAEKRRALAKRVVINLRSGQFDPRLMVDLKSTLERFPGDCASRVTVIRPEASVELKCTFKVDPSDGFRNAVEAIAGPGSVCIQ
jgi:DNA polymerase-3 subunit alpha